MKFEIESSVSVTGLGNLMHYHTQEFSEDSNVFGRVLEYHEYMKKTFPNCDFKMISAKEVWR